MTTSSFKFKKKNNESASLIILLQSHLDSFFFITMRNLITKPSINREKKNLCLYSKKKKRKENGFVVLNFLKTKYNI